jgi:hypothetical protein
VLDQLDDVLKEFDGLKARSKHNDLSDLPHSESIRFSTRALAVVHRVAGVPSAYVEQAERIASAQAYPGIIAAELVGVVASLRADVAAGYLQTQRELSHREVFADFLEMSQHLLDEGYKDAAAVIAGSSLEAHLRQLCAKAAIPVAVHAATKVTPKRADRLNADLASAGVYGNLDLKNITAWLDLRNKAAHGHYEQYQAGQVALVIASVRDFITRYPA